jgi:HSP20 family protein
MTLHPKEDSMTERAISHQTSKTAATRESAAAITPKFVEPEEIYNRMNELHDAIARRAFELFEGDGAIMGRDLDHWFRAEAELLHPAHVQVREADDAIVVDAEVPGFSANELELSLEPRRLTISGEKQSNNEQKKGNLLYSERCSKELLRSIELPVEVNISRATATLNNGILELIAPKATRNAAVQMKAAGAS